MPEFEEDSVNSSQSESYTPSTDASKKPRTRRRSGGFKTEAADTTSANIGEVSASEALKQEKLSGTGKPSEDAKGERSERREREPRTERQAKEPRQERKPKEPRRDTNPQPSEETLAAIARVESKIAERRAERDTRRAEREKNKPAHSERKSRDQKGGKKPAAKKNQKKGIIASILSIFGIGPKQAPNKKKGNNRGGRPQGNGGNRGGQNRGRGGKGGNRGGQGRRRGGQGGNGRRNNNNASS